VANRRSKLVRAGRELALRALYAGDLSGDAPASLVATGAEALGDSGPMPQGASEAAIERLAAIDARGAEVDKIVQAASPRWKLSRMAAIDRNILRLGVLELLEGQTPPKDVIYDCVELAKQYGDKDTYKFVNGLLDQVCRDNGIAL
jgi:transcription antitermination protein NusB